MARVEIGARLRVIDLDELTCAPGKKPSFAAGSEVVVERVHPSGHLVRLKGHDGWWKLRRFESAQ